MITELDRRTSSAQRTAYLTAALLIAVGLAHGVIWLVVGGTAEGPLSWRKPTTFGVSFGLTLVTLVWVSGRLGLSDRAQRVSLGVLSGSFAVEVAWVCVQHARGVMSHFNDGTALDGALFVGAGIAIGFAVAVIAVYTVRSFTAPAAPPATILALRAGLLVLLVSMGAGVWMILRGTAFDLEPATVGVAGSIKLVHAVGMHAIQVLLAVAWLANRGTDPRGVRYVALAAVGYVLLLGTVSGLALAGAAASAPGPVGLVGGTAGVVCLLVAGIGTVLRLTHTPGPGRATDHALARWP